MSDGQTKRRMESEGEISLDKSHNGYRKLILNILHTANCLNLKQIQFLKPYGLSPQQYNVLRILRGQHPKAATVSLLIERMLDKSSNASRLVEKLRRKDLVEREECPDDRRVVNVRITEKGLALLKKLGAHMDQFDNRFEEISREEAKSTNALLDRLRD
jgi:DNA-binding MarR family transcriptional regulator